MENKLKDSNKTTKYATSALHASWNISRYKEIRLIIVSCIFYQQQTYFSWQGNKKQKNIQLWEEQEISWPRNNRQAFRVTSCVTFEAANPPDPPPMTIRSWLPSRQPIPRTHPWSHSGPSYLRGRQSPGSTPDHNQVVVVGRAHVQHLLDSALFVCFQCIITATCKNKHPNQSTESPLPWIKKAMMRCNLNKSCPLRLRWYPATQYSM